MGDINEEFVFVINIESNFLSNIRNIKIFETEITKLKLGRKLKSDLIKERWISKFYICKLTNFISTSTVEKFRYLKQNMDVYVCK